MLGKKIGVLTKKLNFLPNYYLAIASGARNLVESERKWQEVAKMRLLQ